ncbi:hypothetical protein Rsub_03747 [Raphidocelis subcapitata]|uniref:Uncharacterized protein n=1 Tax=Raphidocelis subcapitata TaxID=307507 RepID=A0A2V0NW31_9CHLO|nr:hypothetical protein Rsub_03747 [Raphidocelis subcapitata]|eukprot:GBF90892.1 hypothetical protein Rsub_03747 [Raphidocelis subcapitata]
MVGPRQSRHPELAQALARVQDVRHGVEEVLDACAGLPGSAPRVSARLHGVGSAVDALHALWPQLEDGGLLASGAAAARCEGDGAAGIAAGGGEQQEEALGEQQAPQQRPGARPAASPAPLALRDAVTAALPELGAPAKRQRLAGGGPGRWQYADRLLAVVEAVRTAAPGLQVELMNSFSNTRAHHPRQADEVRVLCPGVFCAAVAIAGGGRTQPVRVAVDAADAAPNAHAWATSQHQCFRRISALAALAAVHFSCGAAARQLLSTPAVSGGGGGGGGGAAGGLDGSGSGGDGGAGAAGLDALECLLLWLASYSDLFSRPCAVTGTLLCWEPASEVPLPPLVRPFKLSREQLAAAAGDPGLRMAWHAHAAPRDALLPRPPATGSGARTDDGDALSGLLQ